MQLNNLDIDGLIVHHQQPGFGCNRRKGRGGGQGLGHESEGIPMGLDYDRTWHVSLPGFVRRSLSLQGEIDAAM